MKCLVLGVSLLIVCFVCFAAAGDSFAPDTAADMNLLLLPPPPDLFLDPPSLAEAPLPETGASIARRAAVRFACHDPRGGPQTPRAGGVHHQHRGGRV